MIKTGVSCSEVVQRDAASHRLQIPGNGPSRRHVLCHRAFSNLGGCAFKRKPGDLGEPPDLFWQS